MVYGYSYLVGGWPYPSEKWWISSVGPDDIPNIWKNKKCSKPPIRTINHPQNHHSWVVWLIFPVMGGLWHCFTQITDDNLLSRWTQNIGRSPLQSSHVTFGKSLRPPSLNDVCISGFQTRNFLQRDYYSFWSCSETGIANIILNRWSHWSIPTCGSCNLHIVIPECGIHPMT